MTEHPLVRYASDQLDAIRGGEAGMRSGDPDAVHDTRVAARRLRSTLRTFAPDTEQVRDLRAELRWLGGLIGAVRDRQVLAENLRQEVAAEPPELVIGPVGARIQAVLAARTADAQRELTATLDGERYAGLLAAADTVIDSELGRADEAELRRLAGRALRRARRSLSGAAERGDEALHEARKAYKRARYAVEVLRPLDPAGVARWVRRVTALQDLLGSHQDSVVSRQLLWELGMSAFLDGENAFTYGLLYVRHEQAARETLGALPAVSRRVNRRRLRRRIVG